MWGNNFSSWQNSAANSKTGSKLWSTARLNWILIVVLGVGGLLLLTQLAYPFLVDNQALPATVQEQSAGADGSAVEPANQPETTGSESFLADYDPTSPSLLAEDDRPWWQVTADLAVKLAFVIALIYGVIALLRWIQRHKLNSMNSSHAIQVLETIGLAPGRTLHLVEVGHKTLLIGATDHQLTLLTELVPPSSSSPQPEPEFEQPVFNVEEADKHELPKPVHSIVDGAETPAPPVPNFDDPPLPDDHLERMYRRAEPAVEFNQTLDWQVKVGDIRQSIQRIRESSGK